MNVILSDPPFSSKNCQLSETRQYIKQIHGIHPLKKSAAAFLLFQTLIRYHNKIWHKSLISSFGFSVMNVVIIIISVVSSIVLVMRLFAIWRCDWAIVVSLLPSCLFVVSLVVEVWKQGDLRDEIQHQDESKL